MAARFVADCLQKLIEQEKWKNDPELLNWLWEVYNQLADQYPDVAKGVGTPAWLSALLGEDAAPREEFEPGPNGQQEEEEDSLGEDAAPQVEEEEEERVEDSLGEVAAPQVEEPGQQQTGHGLFYELHGPQEIENKKFGVKASEYVVEWRDMEECPDLDETVLKAVQEVVDRVFSEGSEEDLVNVKIDHAALDTPAFIGFSPQRKLTAEKILLLVKKIQQSKRDLNFDSGLRITLTRIRMPKGGRPAPPAADWDAWFKKHSGHGGCFVQIKNQDNLCFARAVVTAIAHREQAESPEAKRKY